MQGMCVCLPIQQSCTSTHQSTLHSGPGAQYCLTKITIMKIKRMKKWKNLKQKIFWHTIRQKPALSAYSMIAIASQYSDLAHGFNVYNGRNTRKRPGEIVSGNQIFLLSGLICWHLPCVQVFYVCCWEFNFFKVYLNLAFTEAGFLFLFGGRFFYDHIWPWFAHQQNLCVCRREELEKRWIVVLFKNLPVFHLL